MIIALTVGDDPLSEKTDPGVRAQDEASRGWYIGNADEIVPVRIWMPVPHDHYRECHGRGDICRS